MKKALILLITIAFFAAGCKKNDAEPSVESSWTLGTTSYKAALSYRITSSGSTVNTLISFYDAIPTGSNTATINSAVFTFLNPPTVSGSYELVSIGTALNANNFQLAAGGPAGVYAYIGTGAKVNITITNGKAKIVVPEVMLKSTSSLPDAKFTATVLESN
ncbi:hypothetical protein [Mucilaginibacter sp. HD30]